MLIPNVLKIGSTKTIIIALCSTLLMLSNASFAIGLSTYRIYLDNEHREQNFFVYNRDAFPQDCKIKMRYYSFDKLGKMTVLKDEKKPDWAADKFVRFSPKSFQVGSGQSQAVRFKLRRKSKAEVKEYRSYISLDCELVASVEERKLKGNVQLVPKLRHNVPLIIRTGKIDVELAFANISVNKGTVNFKLTKKGKRSTYGIIRLVDRTSQKVIAEQKAVSLHMETEEMTMSFSTKNIPVENLILRFIEDEALSGNKVIEEKVKA